MTTFYPFGSGQYTLNSGISSTATSITLSSFTEPVSGTPYTMALLNTDIAYGTISPKTSKSEFVSFTGITQNVDGTATLTGVVRGLAKKYPFTTSSTFKLPHSGQDIFIISNPPQLYVKYPAKENDEIITGTWTFNNFPITPATPYASSTVTGMSKLSLDPVSPTSPIAVGTNDGRVPVAYAVDAVGTDSYAITPSPAVTAYFAGQVVSFKAGTANTGACTLNVSGLGAKSIKKDVLNDLVTGDILANQIITVEYDGTNFQLQSLPSGIVSNTATPAIQTFTGSSTSYGSVTTQFDITFLAGTTYRYTWDTNGTDPTINTSTFPTGIPVMISSDQMSLANTGFFIVTGSGTNYFEVSNAAGVAENNKTLEDGYLKTLTAQTYTKPTGLKYIMVEVQGAGAGGQALSAVASNVSNGGGAGAYSKKVFAAASIGSTETLYVGVGGSSIASTYTGIPKFTGGSSIFGALLTAPGGSTLTGGTASGGNVNISGQNGASIDAGGTSSGAGGNSFLGFGGAPLTIGSDQNGNPGVGYGGGGGGAATLGAGTVAGGTGATGIIIVTEYF